MTAAGAGATTQQELSYLPEYLFYTAAAQLANMTVQALGVGTITQLDAAGLNAFGRLAGIGQVTNGYIVRLADGVHKGRKSTISITTDAGGAAVSVFGFGKASGNLFVESIGQTVNQNAPVTLTSFLAAAFPAATGTDNFTITWADGTTEQMAFQEIQAVLSTQQVIQNTGSDYLLQNNAQQIKKVTFYPLSGPQNVYTLKLMYMYPKAY
jgi:hypothetical protein